MILSGYWTSRGDVVEIGLRSLRWLVEQQKGDISRRSAVMGSGPTAPHAPAGRRLGSKSGSNIAMVHAQKDSALSLDAMMDKKTRDASARLPFPRSKFFEHDLPISQI
jgi:hypothetical protein